MAETENKIPQEAKKRLVKAQFAYIPVNFDELTLKIDDIVEVLEETEEGWWKGRISNGEKETLEGMFPSNFVIEIKQEEEHQNPQISKLDVAKTNNNNALTASIASDTQLKSNQKNAEPVAPRLPPKPVREQARVIYPYTALNEDELSLCEGDIITVISKEVEDKGWWKGELRNKTGVFPDNFVQLILLEEQKKPERPDKPSVARSSKVAALKSVVDSRTDRQTLNTPPAKPPPPELHKKDSPPFPSKKPPLPQPMKKPSRTSLGSNFLQNISSSSPPHTSSQSKSNEISCQTSLPTVPLQQETKTNDEIATCNKDSNEMFETLESCGKKLIHLTANRAKVPNRRPPSHIFLRDTEKSGRTSSSDPRRLSEPNLPSSARLDSEDLESMNRELKTNTIERECKIKVPPTRPLPPSIKPILQTGLLLTKTISSEECIVKAPEPIKGLPADPPAEVPQLKKVDLHPSEFKPPLSSSMNDGSNWSAQQQELKSLLASTVSKQEFHELVKQVNELKQSLESCKQTIAELTTKMEAEKTHRLTLEAELQHIRKNTGR